MRSILVFLLVCALPLSACQPGAQDMVDTAATYDTFGEQLSPESALPVQTVMADLTSHLDRELKIEGVIVSVCQMRGCWFALQTDSESVLRIEVPRDEEGEYVFTVPTDINGRRVIVEGTLVAHEMDGATNHHLHEDAGDDPENALSIPEREYLLTTRGVLVEKASA